MSEENKSATTESEAVACIRFVGHHGRAEGVFDLLKLGGFTVTPRVRAVVGRSIEKQGRVAEGMFVGLKRRRVPILLDPSNPERLRALKVQTLSLSRLLLAVCGVRIWSWVMQRRGLVVLD